MMQVILLLTKALLIATSPPESPSFDLPAMSQISTTNAGVELTASITNIESGTTDADVYMTLRYDAADPVKNLESETLASDGVFSTSTGNELTFSLLGNPGTSDIYVAAKNRRYNVTLKREEVSSLTPEMSRVESGVAECTFTEWGPWGPCSNTCGGASRTRQRELIDAWCDSPVVGEGEECELFNSPCPNPTITFAKTTLELTYSDTQDQTFEMTGTLNNYRGFPLSLDLSTTNNNIAISSYSIALDQKTITFIGTVKKGASGVQVPQIITVHNGASDNYHASLHSLNTFYVDVPFTLDVDCVWSWGEWGDCSEPCGRGHRTREMIIIQESQNNGDVCPEWRVEVDICTIQDCDSVDCRYGWTPWSECTATCVSASTSLAAMPTRQRDAVLIEGSGCLPNPSTETETCSVMICPVDCEFTYGPWTECTASCGGGVRSRSITVAQEPANGGIPCPVLDTDYEYCNTQICPKNCTWNWSEWTDCTFSCGAATRSRVQENYVPAVGGGVCIDYSGEVQVEDCPGQPECVNSCRDRCTLIADKDNDCSCVTGCKPFQGSSGDPLVCCKDYVDICESIKAPTDPPTTTPTFNMPSQMTCKDRCGTAEINAVCNCDFGCEYRGDCCSDHKFYCDFTSPQTGPGSFSCDGFCGRSPPGGACACTDYCGTAGHPPCCQNWMVLCAKDCALPAVPSVCGETLRNCHCTLDCVTYGDCCSFNGKQIVQDDDYATNANAALLAACPDLNTRRTKRAGGGGGGGQTRVKGREQPSSHFHGTRDGGRAQGNG